MFCLSSLWDNHCILQQHKLQDQVANQSHDKSEPIKKALGSSYLWVPTEYCPHHNRSQQTVMYLGGKNETDFISLYTATCNLGWCEEP